MIKIIRDIVLNESYNLNKKEEDRKRIHNILTNPKASREDKLDALKPFNREHVTAKHIHDILMNDNEDPHIKDAALFYHSHHVKDKHLEHLMNNPNEDEDVKDAASNLADERDEDSEAYHEKKAQEYRDRLDDEGDHKYNQSHGD